MVERFFFSTWEDCCGGHRDHSFVRKRVSKVRLGRALPGRAKSAGGLKAEHFDSHFVFLKFSTSTAGFCPNRKASSRSTGPGGLAAAGSSHSKSEAASNLHLGGGFLLHLGRFVLVIYIWGDVFMVIYIWGKVFWYFFSVLLENL